MYVCNAFRMDPNLLTTNVLAHFSNISPGALFAHLDSSSIGLPATLSCLHFCFVFPGLKIWV